MTIVLTEPSQQIRVQLVDLAGGVVLDRSIAEGSPSQAISMTLEQVPTGLYACSVTTEHGVTLAVCLVR